MRFDSRWTVDLYYYSEIIHTFRTCSSMCINIYGDGITIFFFSFGGAVFGVIFLCSFPPLHPQIKQPFTFSVSSPLGLLMYTWTVEQQQPIMLLMEDEI